MFIFRQKIKLCLFLNEILRVFTRGWSLKRYLLTFCIFGVDLWACQKLKNINRLLLWIVSMMF